MKILEPVDQSDIPAAEGGMGGPSKHAGLYERVLSLNGKALPLVFKDTEEARRQANAWRTPWSGCRKRGIRVQQRGNTLYLSKKVS